MKILSKYISFWLVLLFVLTITNSGGNTIPEAFQWLIFQEPVKGYGHIWFIPYILLCYFLTPTLLCFYKTYEKHKNISLISLLVGIEIIFDCFIPYFNPAWINCYLLGLFMGKIKFPSESENWKNQLCCTITISILALVVNSVRILVKLFHIEFDAMWNLVYQRYTNYAHVFLGISIFLISYYFFDEVSKKSRTNTMRRVNRFLDLSDKYSFDVFFVHPFFISGALSVTTLVTNKYLASFLAILFSILAAIAFHWFDKGIRYAFSRIIKSVQQG